MKLTDFFFDDKIYDVMVDNDETWFVYLQDLSAMHISDASLADC